MEIAMTFTDDERREVAARLRNNASQDMGWLIPWAAFNDAEHHSPEAVVRRLADLIEPDGADPGPRDLARAWGWR